MALKLKSTHLNPYERAYEQLKVTPYFNQTDWETSMNRSEQDLNGYVNLIGQYDKLGDISKYEDKYLWSQMDTDQHTLLMYNELYGNKTDVKTWDINVGVDSEGNNITEKFEGTEYEYYDKLLQQWKSYKDEENALYARQLAKDEKNVFELVWNSSLATLGEFGLGAVSVFEGLTNFLDAAGGFIYTLGYEFVNDVARGYELDAWSQATDVFRDKMSDNYVISKNTGLNQGLLPEVVNDTVNSLREWERDNTYYMTVDGQRTTAGKLLGDTFYSLGQMCAAMLINAAIPGSGQIAFYGSSFADRLSDKFKDEKYNSVSTEFIVGEAALSTTAEWLVEFGLVKFFGSTVQDTLRGVVSAAPKKGNAISRFISDALQEGAEEVSQELSTWAVSNFAGLAYDEFRTDITIEQLTDAFISGAFSSMIIGGFNASYQYYYKERTSKAVSIFDPNYVELNKEVLTTGKETKEQKQYRRARDKFAETKGIIEETAEYKPKEHKILNKFGLSAVAEVYDRIVGNVDVNTETGQKLLKQLNKQLYASYKLMMDVYGQFGADRAANAEKLLAELNQYADKKQYTQYAEESLKASKTWSEQIDSLLSDKTEAEKLKETTSNAVKKANKTSTTKKRKKKDKEHVKELSKEDETSIEAVFDNTSKEMRYVDILSDEDAELKSAKELSNLFEHELLIWNNHEIVEVDGKIFAPIEAVRNLSATELMKSAAERTIVEHLDESLPNDVKNFLVDKYKVVYGEDLTDNDKIKSIWAALYDTAFYMYLIHNADIRIFDILKTLDNLAIIKIKGDTNVNMYKEYNNAVKRIMKSIGPPLAMYFCNNPKASLENVTVFNKNTLQFINNHNFNYQIANVLIKNDVNDPLFKKYVNLLINKVNFSMTLTNKQQLITDIKSGNKNVISRVLRQLDEEFDGIYFGKYNNRNYKNDFTVSGALINSFVDNLGISYDYLLYGRFNDSIYERVKTIISEPINKDVVKNWYKEQFELFTKNEYTLEFYENDIIVKEYRKSYISDVTPEVFKNADANYKKGSIDGDYYDISNVETDAKQYLGDIFTIDEFDLAYTRIDEIINNPIRYLKNNVIDDIRKDYGILNKTTTAAYLKSLIVNKSKGTNSLTLSKKGQYVISVITTGELYFKPNIYKQNNKSTTLFDTYSKQKDVKVSDFLRAFKVPDGMNLKVEFVHLGKDSKGTSAQYVPASNAIRINLDFGRKITNFEFLDIIIHEYSHAIQRRNNLSSGFNFNFILTDEMYDDVLKHVDGLRVSENDTYDILKDRVKWYLYKTATGETDARGQAANIDWNYIDPTFIEGPDYNQTLVTAWGTKHKVEYPEQGSAKYTQTREVTLEEGEKRKLTPEERKANYDEAVKYRDNINKALELIKQNKANNIKTYKKDLAQFKLPKKIVDQLIKGTYVKKADKYWTYYTDKVIRPYEKGLSRERHKKHFEEGRATDRQRQIFAKNAKGTNLEYWLEKYTNKIPEVDAAVQEFVISATDFDKLDRKLVNQIKNATLTWISIENFIRDADNINQYTFDELKKAFFKNTPFNSFKEVKAFVTIVEDAYALKAALTNVNKDDLVLKPLKVDLKDFKKAFEQLKNNPALKDVYDKTILRFNEFYYSDSQGKSHKHEMNMSEAESDIVLGLLKYFDKSIDSLAYIAGNAKYAVQRSIVTEQPFTYKQKRDAAGRKTISFDTNVKGKKDAESGHALHELIEDERQRLDENSDAENRDLLMKAAYEHVANLLKDGKVSIDELKRLAQTYKKNIRSFSDDEVAYRLAIINTMDNTGITFDEALDVQELVTAIVDPETEIVIGNRANEYKKVANTVSRTAKILSKKQYDNLPNEYKKYFDPKNGFKINADATKNMTPTELTALNEELKQLNKRIKEGEFLSKAAKNIAEKTKREIERLKAENEKLKKDKGATTSTDVKGKIVKTYDIKISTDVEITSTKPMPEKLKKIFEVSFTRERKSTKKFRFIENETYLQASMSEFFRQNAENLQNLTEQDVIDALEFFETASILNRDYVPYDTIRAYLLGYFIEQSKIIRRFNLDTNVLERMERMLDGMVSNVFARGLSAFKGVMTLVDPTRTIVNEMLKIYDIDLEGEPEVEQLSKALKQLNNKYVVKYNDKDAELQAFKDTVDYINQTMNNLERKLLEKHRQVRRDRSKDLKIFGKTFKRKNAIEIRDILAKTLPTSDDVNTIKKLLGEDIFNDMVRKGEITLTKNGAINRTKASLKRFENALERYEFAKVPSTRDLQNRILKFQKAMMLSAPATIVRNKLSNLLIGGYTFSGTKIKLGKKEFTIIPEWKDAEGNYKHVPGLNDFADLLGRIASPKIVGKTSVEQYNFAKVKVSRNTMEFIQKWVRDTGLLDLVSDGLSKYDTRETKVRSTLEDQLMSMIVKSTANRVIGTNTYDNDVLNNIVNFIFKQQSDNTAIQNTALRLFGKMLEVDKVDLTHGLNDKVMTYLANAYSEAAYEYMHRGNVLNDMMNNLKTKHPNAHFVINLVQPFISSSWNWFTDTLQMNPIALAINVRRLMTLENYVNKLYERRQRGDMSVPDSRFAEMLIRRNIGKGIIGTGLMLVGGLLAAFGKIVVDDEDEKLKLKIGNTYIDFSNVYGTSAILVGAQLGSGGGDFWILLESAFNQQFEDCLLTTFMNMFRYESTPWKYMTSLPTTVVSSFIPNVWKQAVKLTQNHTINYDSGALGNLQYLAVQTIPFIEYAMPKGIDPYTGEWEERYSIPAIHQLVTLIGSPISFKTYHKSDVELAFDEVGLTKNELNGKYKDIGQVDVELLNEFYGKQNKKIVTQFINNRVKYTVEDENGKRKELYYKQMTDAQRKNVLNRITTQNANYAKIYAWTQMGHKYYCKSSERTELMKLGIVQNIYIGNKGFVK